MTIANEQDLERAVQEYQRLKDARKGTDEAQRRDALDAEIKAYYVQHAAELQPGKPYK